MCVDQVFQLLVSVHATSGYQNNASTDHKDSTDDVEDCGTHATSGRKDGTGVVYNSCCLLKVSCSVIITGNCKCRVSRFVLTRRYSTFNQCIGSISKTCKCSYGALSVRSILSNLISSYRRFKSFSFSKCIPSNFTYTICCR